MTHQSLLRLNGLIDRLEASNTYVPTDEGQRVAIFYSKSTSGCSGHSRARR